MSCSPFDLRDYFLQELTDPQQRQVEAHVKTCQPCREELDRLSVTQAALLLAARRRDSAAHRVRLRQDLRTVAVAALAGGLLGIGRAPGIRFGGHAFGRDRGLRAAAGRAGWESA